MLIKPGGSSRAALLRDPISQRITTDGRTQQAIQQLETFKSQVNDFIADGVLTPAEGQLLIDEADAIINLISGMTSTRSTINSNDSSSIEGSLGEDVQDIFIPLISH